MRVLVIACVLAACGPSSNAPDAGPIDAAIDAEPDSPYCMHVVYLNFEGGMFSPGVDDARTNVSIVVANAGTATRTLPAYLAADADRATKIAAIATQVQMTLPAAMVVTARPASGAYDMVAIGGAASDLGLTSSRPAAAPVPADCTRGVRRGIAFVFAATLGETNLATIANYAIGTYGFMKGVAMSTTPGDCMCLGTSCSPNPTACALGAAGTPRDPQGCGAGATFDEQAAFGMLPCD